MKRKIQKIGGSFYLNLPMNWINNRKISENSELEIIIQNDGSLKIAPEIEIQPKESENHVILPSERYVARQVIRKCLTGSRTIIVQSKEPIEEDIRKDIYRFIKKLPSAEVIDENETKIIVQNFRYNSIPTKQAIKRMHQLTCKIFDNLLEGNIININDYIEEIDRFFIIVIIHIRHFLTHEIYSGSTNNQEFMPIEALDYRMLAENIQRISKLINVTLDLHKYYGIELSVLDPRVKAFGKKVRDLFDGAMKCFFKGDSDRACEIWEMNYKLVEEAEEIHLKELETELDRLIVVNFLRIADYSKRISDLVP
ncbi:MAG: PhoU domain-containing protein [Promethearchaeota archaeon]